MILCWGIEFRSVQHLWEHPRCYVSTLSALRHRLKTLPPEKAVVPEFIRFFGKKYRNIYDLHKNGCGESLSLSSLYKRLGLIYNDKKLTPEQLISPKIWNRLAGMERWGYWETRLATSPRPRSCVTN